MKFLKMISAVMCLSFSVSAYAVGNVGIVNMQRVMIESQYAKRIQSQIQNQLKPKSQRLQSKAKKVSQDKERFEKNAVTMSNEQRLAKEQSIMNDILEIKKLESEFATVAREKDQEALKKMSEKVKQAIEKIAREEGYDLILHAETVMYAPGATDLTDKLIKMLK